MVAAVDTLDERKCHLSFANQHQRTLGENPVCRRIATICLGGTPVPVVLIKVLCLSDSSWWQVVNKSFSDTKKHLLMKLSSSFSNWEINIRAGRISSLKAVMANNSLFCKIIEMGFVSCLGCCVHLLALNTQVFSVCCYDEGLSQLSWLCSGHWVFGGQRLSKVQVAFVVISTLNQAA